MTQYLTEINMRVLTCSCGITWAAPETWIKERENDHKIFYCPNGCERYFPGESKEGKLKRQLKTEQECCLQAKKTVITMKKSVAAHKGYITRLKKKINNP